MELLMLLLIQFLLDAIPSCNVNKSLTKTPQNAN
jgi:hypothetical protein